MTTTEQTRVQFLTEDPLVEVLNNQWKVDAIESNHQCYYQTEIEEGRKYIKLITWLTTLMVIVNVVTLLTCSLIKKLVSVTNPHLGSLLQRVFVI